MSDPDYNTLASLPAERRWHGQAFPAPIVVALIRRQFSQPNSSETDAHTLLIRRKSSPYDGHWALVGGKWDFGETLHEAIIREVKEETDLDTAFVAVRGLVSERIMPHQDMQQAAHFLLFVCELAASDGQAKEQDEGEIGWFSSDQIEELHSSGAIIPSDYAMIRNFAGTSEAAAYVEAEMRAPIDTGSDDPVQLDRFERIEARDLRSG